MDFNDHGGDCCGITHLHMMGSPSNPKETLNVTIEDIVDGLRTDCHCFECRDKGVGHLIEVVINGGQRSLWDSALKDRGFNMVTSFLNSNSGNTCYVYHLIVEEE